MYSSIYRVQSSTRRLPIRALFGFMLKQPSPALPSLSESLVWWFVLGSPWVASIGHSEDLLPKPEPPSLSQYLLPTPDLSSPTQTSVLCPWTFGLFDLTLRLISMTLGCLTSLCLSSLASVQAPKMLQTLSNCALSPTWLSDSTPGCPAVSSGSQPMDCHLTHLDSAPVSRHPSQLPDRHLQVLLITPDHPDPIPRSPRMVAIVALQPTLCSLGHSSPASDTPAQPAVWPPYWHAAWPLPWPQPSVPTQQSHTSSIPP